MWLTRTLWDLDQDQWSKITQVIWHHPFLEWIATYFLLHHNPSDCRYLILIHSNSQMNTPSNWHSLNGLVIFSSSSSRSGWFSPLPQLTLQKYMYLKLTVSVSGEKNKRSIFASKPHIRCLYSQPFTSNYYMWRVENINILSKKRNVFCNHKQIQLVH